MNLTVVEMEETVRLLNALNGGTARLAATGPVPFILSDDTWVYVDWDPDAMAHVLVEPR